MVGTFSRRRVWIGFLAGIVVLLALVYVRFAVLDAVNHDEVEHAHVAFKMLHGAMPYRDFYQNHWPAYWLLAMQTVRTFPFSTHAILAGRAASLLALAGCWLLGLRLLGSIRGGRTWFGISIYTWALITVACQVEFHLARPDPVMVLLGTAGLCLIPPRGNISSWRALLLGALFGLSASVSPKALPMALAVPALVFLHCIRGRRLHPATALFPYGLGMVSGLLPTALWIFHNGLFEAFRFDVFGLNFAFSKPWHHTVGLLPVPIYLASVLGTLLPLRTSRQRPDQDANGPLVMALAQAAGFVLACFARHEALYNLQILTVPVAAGFAGLVLHLFLRTRGSGTRLLLCAALLGYPTLHVASPLVRLKTDPNSIPQHELQIMMDMAKPGNRTCTAFAPFHPVFCHDAGGLSNSWDERFAERVRNPRQIERFRNLWHDGMRRTLERRPDIILRRSPWNVWERAVQAGLVTQEELDALDALRPAYDVRHIGKGELWIRRSKE